MKNLVFLLLSFIVWSCKGQEQTNTNPENPKGSWSVNKKYDENGNLISYDSTYFFSSHQKWEGDFQNVDSLFRSFGWNKMGLDTQLFFGSPEFHMPNIFQDFFDRQDQFLKDFIQRSDSLHRRWMDEMCRHEIPPGKRNKTKQI
ncbi:hypothetical protein [Luteibaculum oceani]|uniref:Uncharacterized protein n=1 Tax=Luteibaculum oceani TaxID=1294296 RepID=A0A5C6UYM3_9FLAO|nr:hypothetical protein [Luteibaculum oceani]TXC78512.1 hypothetical protein FRX97_07270 [Luteibaculum oceani]